MDTELLELALKVCRTLASGFWLAAACNSVLMLCSAGVSAIFSRQMQPHVRILDWLPLHHMVPVPVHLQETVQCS